MTPAERFLAKVSPEPNTGCWLWTAALDGSGYGCVTIDKRSHGAHRASYMLFVDPIPAGLSVLHRCDTPLCVNPAHLFTGTQADNWHDMLRKGRQVTVQGGNHPNARLTENDVRAIRHRVSAGEPQGVLAQEYRMSYTTINNVVQRVSWRHVA